MKKQIFVYIIFLMITFCNCGNSRDINYSDVNGDNIIKSIDGKWINFYDGTVINANDVILMKCNNDNIFECYELKIVLKSQVNVIINCKNLKNGKRIIKKIKELKE